MNIAFVTLLVLVALFPGFFFQSSYHSGPFSRKYFRTSVFNNIAGAILPSIIYHSVAISLIQHSTLQRKVDFESIGVLLLGSRDTDTVIRVFNQNVGQSIGWITLYILISVVVGGSIGFLLAFLVRKYRLDLHWEILRFDNSWHYLMIGEMRGWYDQSVTETERNEILQQIKNRDFDVRAKILICVSDEAYVYSGIVHRYFLNKDGLDRIHLRECYRTPLPRTREESDAYAGKSGRQSSKIKLGDDIIIFRDTIINIDIDYQRAGEIIAAPPEEVKSKFLEQKGYRGLGLPRSGDDSA